MTRMLATAVALCLLSVPPADGAAATAHSIHENAPALLQQPEARSTLLWKGSTMVTIRERFGCVKAGDVLGSWTVLGPAFSRGDLAPGKGKQFSFVCRCKCGRICAVSATRLNTRVTSLRCHSCAGKQTATIKHGFAAGDKDPLYSVWLGIKTRCFNPHYDNWHRYGGRGITVCVEWRDDFTAFRRWCVANGYASGLHIDRIDNDGNYEPGNCRFVTPVANMRNKSTSRFVTAFGETKTISAWVQDARCVVRKGTLRERLDAGWEPETAITKPSQKAARA